MKGFPIKRASQSTLPSDISGEGGGGLNEQEGSLMATLFPCSFLDAPLKASFQPPGLIPERFGHHFGSLLGARSQVFLIPCIFQKSCSRAGESSKIRVPGSLKYHKNRLEILLDCGIGPGTHLLKKTSRNSRKMCSKRDYIREPKRA